MKETRKVQGFGNSLYVSFPQEWLKANGCKEVGSELSYSFSEDFKEIRFRKSE